MCKTWCKRHFPRFTRKHIPIDTEYVLLNSSTVESWENYPCRPQLLEFVNAPIHVNMVLNVFRSFMSTKMKSRVKVSKRGTHIGTLVNLPPELGGTGDSYHDLTLYWKKQVQDHAFWFTESEQYKMQSL